MHVTVISSALLDLKVCSDLFEPWEHLTHLIIPDDLLPSWGLAALLLQLPLCRGQLLPRFLELFGFGLLLPADDGGLDESHWYIKRLQIWLLRRG